MARKTTANRAQKEAMKRAVKALGQSVLTGAWKSSAHTSQYVRQSENLWSAPGVVCKKRTRMRSGIINHISKVFVETFISYPAGLNHSKRKMLRADS